MNLDAAILQSHEALEPDPHGPFGYSSSLDMDIIVRSAAYASDCPIGAFLGGTPGQWRGVASFGMVGSPAMSDLGRLLDKVILPRAEEVTVINDIVTSLDIANSGSNSVIEPTIRFVSIFRVVDQVGQMVGALVVADAAPHAGLGAIHTSELLYQRNLLATTVFILDLSSV